MASNNSSVAIQNSRDMFVYAIIILRVIATLAICTNLCVLFLLVCLKRSFRNYSYWFQIFVLASEDSFNALASFGLTLYDFVVFKTNSIACSVILCAYMCAQINTLWAMCSICVNRFRSIQNISTLVEQSSGYLQEISIVLVAIFSIVYASIPFLTLNITENISMCSAAFLFGVHVKTYKFLMSLGLIIPLVVINILYGICLVKLKHVMKTVKPMNKCSYVTKESLENNVSTTVNSLYIKTERDNMVDKNFEQTNDQKMSNPGDAMNSMSAEGKQQPSHHQVTGIIKAVPTVAETCSASTANSVLKSSRKHQPRYFNTRRNTREAQYRAIKLLGIILFMSNIATVIPVSFLLRDVIVSEDASSENASGGRSAVGIVFLSLNSLVDAIVYGLYSIEIRTFLILKLSQLRQLLTCSRVT